MKKIFLSFILLVSSFTFAQDYDTYPQGDYSGYEYYDNSYDYPDNYYYNYPADYYPDAYYQGYYNDYNRTVFSVDWNRFFIQFNLSPWQVNQIILLNNRFPTFAAWNSYYRWNPDRWYYDRFFALQNILGPNIFVVYQNVYFRGRSPIVFYRNRFVNFYAARYPVRPVYRNVNINIYRIDRNNFRNGFREPIRNNINPPRSGANGGFSNPRVDNNGGIRNSQNSGFRNDNEIRGGIRSEAGNNDGIRTTPSPRNEIRNGQERFRKNSERTTEPRSNSREKRNSVPSNNGRNPGIRIASR